jgi:hydrogenase maturation factor
MTVIPEKADEVLQALRETKEGIDARIIGEATDEFDVVALETAIGGKRIIAQPAGDPIPRIC